MIEEFLEQAQNICMNLLSLDQDVSIEKIKDAVRKVKMILPQITEEGETKLIARLINTTGITQEAPRILDDGTYKPWIIDKWANNPGGRKFWKRYRNYLENEKGFPPKVLSNLDALTDNILDRLENPLKHNTFDKRGMVVGNVQSGKTSNYIGLITKAADAGYQLIIIFAGLHNSLRSQTQLRIDEGFLGYDTVTSRSFSQNTNRIGVGHFDPNVPAHSLTSSAPNGDFRKNLIDSNIYLRGSDPVVAVVKKNNSVLKNLIHWLSSKVGEDNVSDERIIRNIPLLLIDDEADNASINISKEGVSSINGLIRTLLNLFQKSAYVGYTATPYANIFIPPPNHEDQQLKKELRVIAGNKDYQIGEDLFPRNFIINIPPPSNYIGPKKVFGILSEDEMYENAREGKETNIPPIPLYRLISDYQPTSYFAGKNNIIIEELRYSNTNFIPDRHKKGDKKPFHLPLSLEKAIQSFILVCAARRARGQIKVHNSMLVHVTRFVDWQNHIALLVREKLEEYKKSIEFINQEFINQLHDLWKKDFIPMSKEIETHPGIDDPDIKAIEWGKVEVELFPAVAKIQLRAVHGSKLLHGLEPENLQALDYYENRKNGLSVIAVGGNKLSRGLTLEGLSISYYLRSSKMYDTLMQMGRWFGYRKGYLDLCRLYTSSELVRHYKHITVATEEMRAEFDRMYLNRAKPIDFGLKVRTHSGLLTITAANKFRYKKIMSFSFSGDLEETHKFDLANKDFFVKNHKATQVFLEKLGKPTGPLNDSPHLRNQRFVWRGIDYIEIIDYLNKYRTSQVSFKVKLLTSYIESQVNNKNLINWTVALIENSRIPDKDKIDYYCNQAIGMSYRKDDSKDGSFEYELAKAHIIGNFHEYIDLTNEQLEKALKETAMDRERVGKDPNKLIHPNPLRIRENRPETNGLLLIYPLNPSPKENSDPYSDVPIIGLALSFPYIKNDEKITYAVNDVFETNLDYPKNLDLDDYEEDEIGSFIHTDAKLTEEGFIESIEDEGEIKIYLEPTEFFSGVKPNHMYSDDPESELTHRHDLVIPSKSKISFEVAPFPFYTDDEIQRYVLEQKTERVIAQSNKNSIMSDEYIIGLKQSKYVMFAFSDIEAAFSDTYWIIQTRRLNNKYLVAVLNSTLFGAWVRVKGKQKKDKYFIENNVLSEFPLLKPEERYIKLFEKLYNLLKAAHEGPLSDTNVMRSYFSKIMDALVFSCYFKETLKKENSILVTSLEGVFSDILPLGDNQFAVAKDIFEKIYNKKHSIRNLLFELESNIKVKTIKSVFTQ